MPERTPFVVTLDGLTGFVEWVPRIGRRTRTRRTQVIPAPSSLLEVLFNIQLQRNQLDWNAKDAVMRGDTSANYFIDLSSLSVIFQRSRKKPRQRRGPSLITQIPLTDSNRMDGNRECRIKKISDSAAPQRFIGDFSLFSC